MKCIQIFMYSEKGLEPRGTVTVGEPPLWKEVILQTET